MSITLRAQRPDEDEAVRDVVGRAFTAQPVVTELVDLLRQTGAVRYSGVAVDDGQVVGHVMLTRSWLDAPARLVEVLVLSPLSVAPERQREGIGGALVRSATEQAEVLGAPLLFLEGSPHYYGRFGFRAGRPLGFTPPSPRIPDAAFQVIPLPAYEPWMTGGLIYAEAFWALDCVGLRG